ncbi:MAG: hypothetical protein ACC707_02180 [Thiohalomonadales bacterium]
MRTSKSILLLPIWQSLTAMRRTMQLAIVLGAMGLMSPMMGVADVPVPDIPKADAKECVEDTDYMRKNHMDVLLHQRDETMYKGIRTKKHSLKNCIACHVVKDKNARPISAANPRHFCRECHDYTAVKIDCFECHASKPANKESAL